MTPLQPEFPSRQQQQQQQQQCPRTNHPADESGKRRWSLEPHEGKYKYYYKYAQARGAMASCKSFRPGRAGPEEPGPHWWSLGEGRKARAPEVGALGKTNPGAGTAETTLPALDAGSLSVKTRMLPLLQERLAAD